MLDVSNYSYRFPSNQNRSLEFRVIARHNRSRKLRNLYKILLSLWHRIVYGEMLSEEISDQWYRLDRFQECYQVSSPLLQQTACNGIAILYIRTNKIDLDVLPQGW